MFLDGGHMFSTSGWRMVEGPLIQIGQPFSDNNNCLLLMINSMCPGPSHILFFSRHHDSQPSLDWHLKILCFVFLLLSIKADFLQKTSRPSVHISTLDSSLMNINIKYLLVCHFSIISKAAIRKLHLMINRCKCEYFCWPTKWLMYNNESLTLCVTLHTRGCVSMSEYLVTFI